LIAQAFAFMDKCLLAFKACFFGSEGKARKASLIFYGSFSFVLFNEKSWIVL